MKTVRMLRDFDYRPKRKWLAAFKAGSIPGRVPEAAVKAILAAGAGELAADEMADHRLPDPKNRGRK